MEEIAGTVTCDACGKPKAAQDFNRGFRKNGIDVWHGKTCLKCLRRKHRRSLNGWALFAIHRLRRRANEKGVPFTITAKDIVNAFPSDGICPAIKVPFVYGEKFPGPASPSVDKLRPELGYIPGNIRIISHKANRIKQNATPEKLRAVAKWLRGTLTTHAGAV